MSTPRSQLPTVAVALAVAALLTGCVDSPGNSKTPAAGPPAKVGNVSRVGIPSAPRRSDSLQSVSIDLESARERQLQIKRGLEQAARAAQEEIELRNAIRAAQQRYQKYAMQVIQPDASIDYKILVIEPARTKRYTMVVLVPGENDSDSDESTRH